MTRPRGLPPDPVRNAGFPSVEQLRRGLVLNCIAHSFWLTSHEPVFQIYWENDTYFEDNIQGEHMAVSFSEGGGVAVFYSTESSRNPFPEGSPPYDQSWFFRGLPRHLEPARDRGLSQMLDFDFRPRNPTGAVITAAMWADGNMYTAVEPWEDVYDNSGWALQTHLLPPEAALLKWWEGMGFPDALMWAAWSLYQRRLASSDRVVSAELREWQAFVEAAGGDKRRAASAEVLLAPLGITIEPFVSE